MTIARARILRREMTEAERLLWYALRNRQFGEMKFRRQVPFAPYIVDFCCFEKRLVVEVDGGQHGEEDARRYDAIRTARLERDGFRVLRFWNQDVLDHRSREGVFEGIAAALRLS
jgi:very-short-patch-repair endonuclease